MPDRETGYFHQGSTRSGLPPAANTRWIRSARAIATAAREPAERQEGDCADTTARSWRGARRWESGRGPPAPRNSSPRRSWWCRRGERLAQLDGCFVCPADRARLSLTRFAHRAGGSARRNASANHASARCFSEKPFATADRIALCIGARNVSCRHPPGRGCRDRSGTATARQGAACRVLPLCIQAADPIPLRTFRRRRPAPASRPGG
jgi:hypothetical protein